MSRSFLLPAAFAAVLAAGVVAADAPAFAIAIKHTNRAEGDPDAAAAPRQGSHATPPVDTSGPHYFDKSHQDGNRG